MTIHYLNFRNNTFAPTSPPWIDQDPAGTWDVLGEKFSDIDGSGMSLWVTVPFAGSTGAGGLLAQDYFGVPENAWEQWAFTNVGSPSTIELRDVPVSSGTIITVRPFAAVGNNRDLDIITDQGTVRLDHPSSLPPPAEPIDVPVSVDVNGTAVIQFSAVSVNAAVAGLIIEYNEAPTPTITNINTTNEVTPGATATATCTNATNATGINIGSVSQSNFTVVNDTTVTFTGTRGGNPYNQDLTAALLSPDGDATITVQQVPEAGTFAVTAASPNTTDDASLWANTVDTSTGDPVTVVNGDQFWVNSTIPGLAIDPTGDITANETGTFTGQFWRASEGIWGSDQTVGFTLPEEAEDNWPYHKNIRYRAEQTWTWGSRHPKTGMRVRIFNE